MGKKSHGIFSKSLGLKSQNNPMGLKNPRISRKSQKIPKMKKCSKMKKSEKNLKIKEKITRVDVPLCCFFRRLFRDLKFLRNFLKTYRWIPAPAPEMFVRVFFHFLTVFKKFFASCSFFHFTIFWRVKNFLTSKSPNAGLWLVKIGLSTQKRHRHSRATLDSSKFWKKCQKTDLCIPGVKWVGPMSGTKALRPRHFALTNHKSERINLVNKVFWLIFL